MRCCTVDGCSEKHAANGYCMRHYQRLRRTGSLEAPGRQGRSGRPRRSTTYAAAHYNVAAERGAAATHRCVDCGDTAAHWAYVGGCPDELTHKDGRTYSLDPGFYAPRCVTCHHRFDRRKRQAADGDDLMPCADVCEMLGVGRSILSYWRRNGLGPPHVREGSLILYRRSDVESDSWRRRCATCDSVLPIALGPGSHGAPHKKCERCRIAA